MLARGWVSSIAHITGGGITGNLPRALPRGVQAAVELGSWPVLPIFRYLAQLGRIDRDELLKTFNLGVGMILVVPAKNISRVEAELKRRREKFFLIGRVERLSLRQTPRGLFRRASALANRSFRVLFDQSFCLLLIALVSAAIFHEPSACFFQTRTYSLVCIVVLPFLSVTAA